MSSKSFATLLGGAALASVAMAGCADARTAPRLPSANFVALQEGPGEDYVIGPMDELTVFVWRNPELARAYRSVPTAVSPRR
jgi:polysaccharide export outer membrane protein